VRMRQRERERERERKFLLVRALVSPHFEALIFNLNFGDIQAFGP
jgi:hypothetical protein